MKLPNLLTSLALLVGASTSTAFADTDCTGVFATAMNDDCYGRTPPPPPPPPPSCGSYQITVTAEQLFPELAMGIQRAPADLASLRRQLADVERRHQQLAVRVYELPPGSPAYSTALRDLNQIAYHELSLRRQITALERFRVEAPQYLARVGTQTVRNTGCMSMADAIRIVRLRLGAPPK